MKEDWDDITILCHEVVTTLSPNVPMISHEHFSLHESMSAVELMDPKMDQCCGLSGSVRLESLIRFALPESLTINVMNMIFQSLLICEVQLLDGASPLESINQCVFSWTRNWTELQKINGIRGRIISSFSIDLVKSSRILLKSILSADIYEDEDFHTQTRSSHPEDLTEYSDNTVEELNSLISILINVQNKMDSVDTEVIEQLVDEDLAMVEQTVLLLKLRMQLHSFYLSIESIIDSSIRSSCRHAADKTDAIFAQLEEEREVYEDILRSTSGNISNLNKLTTELLAVLLEIEEKFPKDLPPHTQNSAMDFAFDSKASRSLQVSPMRSIAFTSFLTSVKYLRKLFEEIQHICDYLVKVYECAPLTISDSINEQSTLDYDTILCLVSSVSRNKYHVLARSLLWGGLHVILRSLPVLVRRSMISRGVPLSLVNSEVCDGWTQSLHKVIWDTIRSFCHGRNHVPLRLESSLQSWAVVVRESSVVDYQYKQSHSIQDDSDRQQWVLSWAVLQITNLMHTYLGLISELELLSASELDYFYWYWDYVLTCRLHSFKTLRDLNYALRLSMYQDVVEENKKLKSGRSLRKSEKLRLVELQRILEAGPPRTPEISIEEYVTSACSSIVKGLFRQFVVLGTFGFCQKRSNEYSSWANRFAQRFRAFSCMVHPQALSYDSFVAIASTSTRELSHDILSGSANSFKAAKAYTDELRKKSVPANHLMESLFLELATPLLKVSVAGSVASMRLSLTIKNLLAESTSDPTTGRKDSNYTLVLDSSHHDQFHIPSLKA